MTAAAPNGEFSKFVIFLGRRNVYTISELLEMTTLPTFYKNGKIRSVIDFFQRFSFELVDRDR